MSVLTESLDVKIRTSRKALGNPYAYLNGEGGYDAVLSQDSLDIHEIRRLSGNQYAYLNANGGYDEYLRLDIVSEIRPENLLSGKKKGDRFSKHEIEQIVRKLQLEMWKDRAKIWHRNITPNDVLDPLVALRVVGYRVDISESLGQYSHGNDVFEVAGTVDDAEKRVQISKRFSPEVCNFTTAHELGHAILHQATGLHRDRAQDGGSGGAPRDGTEAEADNFAAFFLMPKKLVKAAFKDLFLTNHFIISEDTAFALGIESATALEKKWRTLRELTQSLASAEQYNGRFFTSLARQFGVSTAAMAIRLEELSLVSR